MGRLPPPLDPRAPVLVQQIQPRPHLHLLGWPDRQLEPSHGRRLSRCVRTRVESHWGRALAQFPGTGCATLPANVHKTLVLVVHRFPVGCRRSWPSRSTPSSTGLAACVMHPRAASRETVWTDKRHHITRLAPALRPTGHRVRRGDHQAPPVNVREGRVSRLERLGSSRGSRTKNSIPAHRPVARPTATFCESVRRGDPHGDAAATLATDLYEGIADTIVQ